MNLLSKSFVVMAALLAGCAGGPGLQLPMISVGFPVEKSESPVEAEPVSIVLPTDGIDTYADPRRGPLFFGGVRFVDQERQGSNRIGTGPLMVVEGTLPNPGGEWISTSMCQVKTFSDVAQRYESCLRIDARVAVVERPDARVVTFTPFRKRLEVGRTPIGVPVPVPDDAGFPRWYALIAAQTVAADYRFVSNFRTESLRANFDRNLRPLPNRMGRGHNAPGAVARSYRMELPAGAFAYVDVAFYPYQDGSLAEVHAIVNTPPDASSRSRDWTALMAGVKGRLEQIASQ